MVTGTNTTDLYLCLGSNVGNRQAALEKAITLLCNNVGHCKKCTQIYESEPWGFACDTPFLNQIVVLQTPFSPLEILHKIQVIEYALGRKRSSEARYAPRTMDIDILFFGNERVELPELAIPHPAIARRRFVLIPLVELNPEGVHPVLQKTWQELLDSCPDEGWVRKFEG